MNEKVVVRGAWVEVIFITQDFYGRGYICATRSAGNAGPVAMKRRTPLARRENQGERLLALRCS